MNNRKLNLNLVIFYIKIRIHFFIILISVFSLTFTFLKIFNFNIVSGLSQIIFLDLIFNLNVFICTIFTLLFLPTYPIIFIAFKKVELKFFEKIVLTILINLSFYVIVGIGGFYLGLPLTAWFFFFIVVISFILIFLLSLSFNIRRGELDLFKGKVDIEDKEEFVMNFSILNHIKRFKFSNSVLLIIFLFLVCMVGILGASTFIGTDPWMHISIIKFITEVNSLPLNDYFGAFGFHIFGAVIHFFSGLDIFLIPRFFVFYTFPISSLIVYVLFMRIFRNKNLAIFGIFVLAFSSLGFLNMMYQFWPSSLALTLGIALFFLLYKRIQSFIQEDEPKMKQIFSNIFFTYFLFIIFFISLLLIHSLIAVIFLISFIFVYLIYFIKSYRRGSDLILLGISLCIFFILYFLNISAGYFIVFTKLGSISWYFIVFGILIIGLLEGIILFYYRRSMTFTKGRFSLILVGKEHKTLKKIEEKYVLPLIFTLVIILMIGYTIANWLLFNFNLITIFTGFELLVIFLIAIWGLYIFQYKPRGKPLLFWGAALVIILIAGISFDLIKGSLTFFSRIFYLSSVIVSIGFVSYFYKLIKNNSIQSPKIKIFLIFITIFSLLATYLEFSTSIEFYSIKRQEASTVQWYSTYTSNQNLIIAEFGWSSIFIYYGYPFNENNATLKLNDTLIFSTATKDFLNPLLHIQDEKNILIDIKINLGKDVFLILSDNYLIVSGFELFDQLTNKEIEIYYNLPYLNRICVSKSVNGKTTPYYWVI